jgi:competence protein ComEA
MNLIHQFLSSWFGFNKQQRNGLLVLCSIVLLLFIVRLSLSAFIKPKPILIADFTNVKLPNLNGNASASDDEKALFVFDPNTVTREQLIALGFKEKTANTFINYRSKGAHFNSKQDVKKVYGVNEELFNRISPYILIPNTGQKPSSFAQQEPKTKKQIRVIELNTADSVSLLPLPGIGPSFAKRIIKYRDLLGGYYAIEQLKEVYGFTDSLYNTVKDHVKADAALIRKVDLNTEDFKKLNAHPYISYEETKTIFNYRRKNGPITNLGQLKICISDETQLKKLEPYLPF